jgi:hypothetical protein
MVSSLRATQPKASAMRGTGSAHNILLDLITVQYSVKNTDCEVHYFSIFSMIRLPPF